MAAGDGADEEGEDYYEYYDEEEDGAEGEGENVPDLMVVGTGISGTTT